MKVTFCIIIGSLIALSVQAATVTVENNVHTSVSSGGNEAAPGEIVEGTAKGSAQVKTVIDGEVVEDVSEEVASPGSGEAVHLERSFEHATGSTKVETHVELDAGPIVAASSSPHSLSKSVRPLPVQFLRATAATSSLVASSSVSLKHRAPVFRRFISWFWKHVSHIFKI